MPKTMFMEGSLAVAHAVKACRPGVITAYPISPQTHIVEEIAKFEAAGELSSKFIRVDSEFSAASVLFGSSATGVRSYTASSSQGLLLMTEVIYALAGIRLPVVMTAVNRTVSAPITIQCDHQDTMALRDSGAIQLYVESNQEAYATHIQAFKLAEDHDILLPVLVCMDGWVLTHSYEPIKLEDQERIDSFLKPYEPLYRLDTKKPYSFGTLPDDQIPEFRYMLHFAQERAKEKINSIAREYQNIFGDYFGGVVDTYCCEDAEIILIAMGSVIGTLREAVNLLREKGIRLGVLKVRSFRPFPGAEIWKAVRGAQAVAVLDKGLSIGQGGALATEIKAAFYNKKSPLVLSCIAGMGGRDVNVNTVKLIVNKVRKALETGDVPEVEYIEVNKSYLQD
jgi:pyruvate ferredoxin oxidoreductase alpha subunit